MDSVTVILLLASIGAHAHEQGSTCSLLVQRALQSSSFQRRNLDETTLAKFGVGRVGKFLFRRKGRKDQEIPYNQGHERRSSLPKLELDLKAKADPLSQMLSPRQQTSCVSPPNMEVFKSQMSNVNANKPSQYKFVGPLLNRIAKGEAARDAKLKSTSATPLFVVMGSCPFPPLCGLQAMMFVAPENTTDPQELDYWWVRPEKKNQDQFDSSSLTLSWPLTPTKSRVIYQPMADWFKSKDGSGKVFQKPAWLLDMGVYQPLADWFNPKPSQQEIKRPRFEMLTDRKDLPARAMIKVPDDRDQRYLLYIWQERWTSPFAKKKGLKGAFVYQRVGGTKLPSSNDRIFARGFALEGDALEIADTEVLLGREDLFSNKVKDCVPP